MVLWSKAHQGKPTTIRVQTATWIDAMSIENTTFEWSLGGLGAPQMTLWGSLRVRGGPLRIPRGPWELLGDSCELLRALLETSVFKFQAGEFVNATTKYLHFQFGQETGQRPENLQEPSYLHNLDNCFLKICERNIMDTQKNYKQSWRPDLQICLNKTTQKV